MGSVEGTGEANWTLSPARSQGPQRAPMGGPVLGKQGAGVLSRDESLGRVDRAAGGVMGAGAGGAADSPSHPQPSPGEQGREGAPWR